MTIDEILADIAKFKLAKRLGSDTFTTAELAAIKGMSQPSMARMVKTLIMHGHAEFAGKEIREGMDGGLRPTPCYRLKAKKKPGRK